MARQPERTRPPRQIITWPIAHLTVLDLRRPERRRQREAAHARQVEQPLLQRVRGGRADPVDGEQAGVPDQDLREAGPEQVDAHVPPGAPAHVAHHRPGKVAHGLHRRRPQDGLQKSEIR